jgi:hypothetical protein
VCRIILNSCSLLTQRYHNMIPNSCATSPPPLSGGPLTNLQISLINRLVATALDGTTVRAVGQQKSGNCWYSVEMGDPLSLVRQALCKAQPIDYADHHYVLAGHRLPESTKTCFKRTLKGTSDWMDMKTYLMLLIVDDHRV